MNIIQIGLGDFGKNHFRILKELNHNILTADTNKNVHADVYDYHDLLGRYNPWQAAIICTPASTHYKITKDCLNHNIPCFVEKPLTIDRTEAAELVDLAREKKLVLSVGHVFRYHPVTLKLIEEMKRIVQIEKQKIYSIRARRIGLHSPRQDCGAMWDFMVHDIDLVHFVMSSIGFKDKTYYESFTKDYPLRQQHEDIASLVYQYDNVRVQIDADWISPIKERNLTIICEKETIEADFVKEEIKIHKSTLLPSSTNDGDSRFNVRMGDTIIPQISHEEPLKLELIDFLSCVKNKEIPRNHAAGCLHAINVISNLNL